ncbi:MAG: hypothetical protein AB7S78_08940 [Candidatus Omnitrophota bacterium]
MNWRTRFTWIKKILMLPVLFSLSGCVYLVVGGIGALGGYVVSPDTVEGITTNDQTTVWDTSLEIVSIMGTVQESSEDAGIILANIDRAKVRVTIQSMDGGTCRISVKARKFLFPKISTAQNVFVKIMSTLNE